MLIGFLCEYDHSEKTFKECLKCAATRKQPCMKFSYEAISGILDQIKPRDYVSVSALRSCEMRFFLEHNIDYYAYPSKFYYLFRGIEFHAIMQQYKKKGCLIEYPLEIEIMGMKLRGTADVIDPKAKTLIDIKTTKQINIKWAINKNYIWQANRYKYMAKLNGIPLKWIQMHYYDFVGPALRDCPILPENEVRQTTIKEFLRLTAIMNGLIIPDVIKCRIENRKLCNDYCPDQINQKCYEILLAQQRALLVKEEENKKELQLITSLL